MKRGTRIAEDAEASFRHEDILDFFILPRLGPNAYGPIAYAH